MNNHEGGPKYLLAVQPIIAHRREAGAVMNPLSSVGLNPARECVNSSASWPPLADGPPGCRRAVVALPHHPGDDKGGQAAAATDLTRDCP